jgi:hypothetical protein
MKRMYLRQVGDARFPATSPEYAANVFRWADVIRQVIRRPLDGQKGADLDEIRRGIHVLDALDAADQVLELEDADWEHLKQKTLAMQWAFVDRRIITFIDDVTGAQEQVTLNAQLEALGDGRIAAHEVV